RSRTGRYQKSEAVRFNDRRRLIFGDTGVFAAAQFAVANSVKEVNRETDREPDKETDPSLERQTHHQHETKQDAENWKQRHQRNTKWPRPICVRSAQDHHAETNQNKSEQGSDVSEIGK